METFFYTAVIMVVLCNLIISFLVLDRIEPSLVLFPEVINDLELKVAKMSAQLDDIQDSIHRSMQVREPLDTAKPIKSNNWDSVRKAFKGPVRIEIDE